MGSAVGMVGMVHRAIVVDAEYCSSLITESRRVPTALVTREWPGWRVCGYMLYSAKLGSGVKSPQP